MKYATQKLQMCMQFRSGNLKGRGIGNVVVEKRLIQKCALEK
jgi:hypothetical protein